MFVRVENFPNDNVLLKEYGLNNYNSKHKPSNKQNKNKLDKLVNNRFKHL